MASIIILLGGESRRLKFNQGAVECYSHKIFSLPIQMASTGASYACIYAGLVGNGYMTGVDFAEDFETVCDWVDNADQEQIRQACDLFASTTSYQRFEKETNAAIKALSDSIEKKKKVKRSSGSKSTK